MTNAKTMLTVSSLLTLLGSSHYKPCTQKLLKFGANDDVPEDLIRALHNEVRRRLVNGQISNQPRATKHSMNPLVWNPQLSAEALKVAKTCSYEPIAVRTGQYPGGLGQNIYKACMKKVRPAPWRDAVESWLEQGKKYKFARFSDKRHRYFGHYTQLVWGNTKEVGCAYAFYKRFHPKTPVCVIIVCHYGPSGNIEGRYPYFPA